MKKIRRVIDYFFGLTIYVRVSNRSSIILSLILFVVFLVAYLGISHVRHVENPDDKIIPSISQLFSGVERALTPDQNGDVPIVKDTLASLQRLSLGVFFGSFIGILLGIVMGLFPFFEALFLRFVIYLGKIPPLALMPIIFVFVGIGEELKVILIAIGLLFPIALDTYLNTHPGSKKGIPSQQLVKALSLGIKTPSLVWNIVIPQLMPSILNSVRLNLLNAWLFLIASEAIAAEAGLGYRIFLVRRYLAMDTIIPYVFWLALLSFLFDAILALTIKRGYPWYEGEIK